MTTIVSHFSPDLDSIASSWIVYRFAGLSGADFAFVGAGKTLNDAPPDADPNIIHVDTGFGRFDHHQPEVAAPDVCAAKLVWQAFAPDDLPLRRMVEYVIEVDNGRQDPGERAHPFSATGLISGLNDLYPNDPQRVMDSVLPLMDAWYETSKELIASEEAFERAEWFESHWGPAVFLDESIGAAQTLAYSQGAVVYVYRSKHGWLGVNAAATSEVNLTPIADRLRDADPGAGWYLHPSKKLLLNGSKKAAPSSPSNLSLAELVDLVRAPARVGTAG